MNVDYVATKAAFRRTRRSLRAVSMDYQLNPNTVYTFLRGGYANVGDPPPETYQRIVEMFEAEGCLVLKKGGKGALRERSGPGKKKPAGAVKG